MAANTGLTCASCARDDNAVPVVEWHYQQQTFALCADCLPQMIHKRPALMQKLRGEAPVAEPPTMTLDLRAH
jgi:hypothetical protein